MSDLGDIAIAYAERGWPVFPVEPRGKRPLGLLVPHGLKDATVDPDVISRWWHVKPTPNIGLPTGISFDVLDIDGPHGMEAINAARPSGAPTIDGPTCHTGRGDHVYLEVTGLGNRAGVLEHVDFRGKGGYVVAPPSIHGSGARYEWMPGWGPEHVEIQQAPAWLLDLLRPPTSSTPGCTTSSSSGCDDAYGRRALESEIGRVLIAPEGARNDQLNQAAFAVGQLIAGGAISDAVAAIEMLHTAGLRCGLGVRECLTTIRSGIDAGSRQPRSAPTRRVS